LNDAMTRRVETTPLGRTIVTEPGRLAVSDPDLCIEYEIYGNAPAQGFGTVIGREIYFRARHDAWSFDVADHKGNLPSDGCSDPDCFYREGAYEKAGYMPFDAAMRIIDRCLSEYIDGAAGPPAVARRQAADVHAARPPPKAKQ
jgi:hypothetical protein